MHSTRWKLAKYFVLWWSCEPSNQQVVTSGIFSLDGEDFDVDNNIWLHPDDGMLWDVIHPDRRIDAPLAGGQTITLAGKSSRCCIRLVTHPAAVASTFLNSTPCSAATPSLTAARAQRDGPLVTLESCSTRSSPSCFPSETARSCTPATATAQQSAPNGQQLKLVSQNVSDSMQKAVSSS